MRVQQVDLMCRTILLMSTKWLMETVLRKLNKKAPDLLVTGQTHMYGMLSTYREQVQYIASLS